jgi:hypothetical protein
MDHDPDMASRLSDTAEPPAPLPEPASAVLPVPLPPPQYLPYSSSMYLPYDSPRPRARVLVTLLWVVAALQVVMVWPGMDDIFELRSLRAMREAPGATPVTFDDLMAPGKPVFMIVGFVQGILWIVMIVFWAMWVHRTYRNLPPLGAEGLSTTPAWAVAYNFIPIVHLFQPFMVMLETFRASDPRHHGGTDWRALAASRLVVGWWALYLVSFLVSLGSAVVMAFSQDLDVKYAAAWVGLFGLLSEIVVLVMQVRIVQRLTNLQEMRAASFGSVPFASRMAGVPAPIRS